MEVVEGIKEGYESDVLETEVSASPTNNNKKNNASDEEDNSKENANDSDEEFTTKYLKRNSFDTSESTSIRFIHCAKSEFYYIYFSKCCPTRLKNPFFFFYLNN